MSIAPLVSPGTRLVANEPKTTKRPSPLMAPGVAKPVPVARPGPETHRFTQEQVEMFVLPRAGFPRRRPSGRSTSVFTGVSRPPTPGRSSGVALCWSRRDATSRPRREARSSRRGSRVAPPGVGYERTVLDDRLAPEEDGANSSMYAQPLVGRFEPIVERGAPDRPLVGGIPDDEIGVRTGGDRSLAGIEPECPGGPCRDKMDEPLDGNAAFEPEGEEQR